MPGPEVAGPLPSSPFICDSDQLARHANEATQKWALRLAAISGEVAESKDDPFPLSPAQMAAL